MSVLSAIGAPFIPGWDQLRPILPELWLIGGIVAVLIAPFFCRKSNALCGGIALVTLVAALLSLLIGGSTSMAGEYYRGMLVMDGVAWLWKVLLLVFTAGVVQLWFAASNQSMREGDGPEFFTLLLGATLGLSLMSSVNNLLLLVMAVEMASLPSYVLAGFRKTHRLGAEASLKYVLFGAACSALMIYGLSFLYGLYGTLQIHGSGSILAQSPGGLGLVALVGLLAGIGFKISAVPFHFWCPDVFEGAGTEVSAFLSVASKGAALVLLLRLVMGAAEAAHYGGTLLTAFAITLGTLGAVTATVGNTAAYTQTSLKRLLAYSSIAHAGYMLCALSLTVRVSADQPANLSALAAQVLLVYLAVYLFMNLGAFAAAAVVEQLTGGEKLANFSGLGRRAPLLAASLALCLVSLIGLPPVAGFWAKLNLLYALFQNGGWWWILIVVIALNTIFSAFYYFRVLRAMYLEEGPEDELRPGLLGLAVSGGSALALVLLFLAFSPLNTLAQRQSHLRPAGGAVVEAR